MSSSSSPKLPLAPSPGRVVQRSSRTLFHLKGHTNVSWKPQKMYEWSKMNINAVVPENVKSYGELNKLARTHLAAIIYDYQFLAYQLSFNDLPIGQIEVTNKLMNSFLLIIKMLTIDEIDPNKIPAHYRNMAINFRNWYADPVNDYVLYKRDYVTRYMNYRFQYDVIDTPQLTAVFTAIRNQKYKEWMEIRKTYLPIFGKMFNRIKHTFAAMVNGTFNYKSITINSYNAMVGALKPYIESINTQITILLNFSPKEKNNLYEYDLYFTPYILSNIKGSIDNFFHSIDVMPNTEEDIGITYEQWHNRLVYIVEQSKQIKTEQGILIDKIESYHTTRNEHLFNIRIAREKTINIIDLMNYNMNRGQNPFFSFPVFSSLVIELTGYYYILDEYNPRDGTVDEYTLLFSKLRERLPVIEKQIESVLEHEKMMDDIIGVIQANQSSFPYIESESDSSFSYSESDLSFSPSSSVETTPVAQTSGIRTSTSPTTKERLEKISPTTDTREKPASVSPPSMMDRYIESMSHEYNIDLDETPYPTYGDEYFFDDFLEDYQ